MRRGGRSKGGGVLEGVCVKGCESERGWVESVWIERHEGVGVD